jgi:5-methylcytosine-specific restriction endonuclease McrA
MDQYKTCTKCGQTKPLSAFAKDKYKKSGYTSACLKCRAAFAKQASLDPKVREKRRAESRAYYHANKPEMAAKYKSWVRKNPERRREIDAKFRKTHRSQQAERSRQYRLDNPDLRSNWSKNNPEKQAAIYARRSFRRRGGKVYDISLAEIRKMYEAPCTYCGAPAEHIDHIIPLARGGEHRIGNLTPACASCNLSKGAKFVMEWKKGKNEAR